MTEEPKVKIQIATETIKAKELMPGDLFSTAGEEYWSNVDLNDTTEPLPIGEKVYIRTNAPTLADDKDVEVTLVTLSYVMADGGVRLSRSHPSYHVVDIDNPKCPYCNSEQEPPVQVSDTDSGEATNAAVNRG